MCHPLAPSFLRLLPLSLLAAALSGPVSASPPPATGMSLPPEHAVESASRHEKCEGAVPVPVLPARASPAPSSPARAPGYEEVVTGPVCDVAPRGVRGWGAPRAGAVMGTVSPAFPASR